jgi:hypothetical protein
MSSLPRCALNYTAFTPSEEQRYQDVTMQAPRYTMIVRSNTERGPNNPETSRLVPTWEIVLVMSYYMCL